MSLFSFNIKKAILFLSLFAINAATQAQNALLFNGSTSYVEIPYAATNNPAQFTVEFWARVDGGAGDFRAPLSNRNYPPVTGFNFYATTANIWSFTGGSGSGNWSELNGPAVVIGQWTHLAATYDGTSYRFYVNGILVNTLVAGFSVNTSRPMRIGAGRTEGGPLYYFPGAVDEVKIWNYARSASQINDNKNVNLSLPQSGLMSYYQFEDGLATSKTGINNGTLINAPTSVTGVSFTIAPTITNFNNITKTYFDASYTIAAPTSNSSGAFTYTSNNSAVATVSGTTVTILGAGTATITAAQAGDATYYSSSVTSTLTVNSVSIVTKNGEFSTTNFNYVNKNGALSTSNSVTIYGQAVSTKSNDGLSAATAGVSALQIKTDFPSAVDGVYWIDVPGYSPKQTYCLMDSAYDGGGWMLALKTTTGTTFNYGATYWTTANTLNPNDVTRNNADAKYDVMNGFSAKDMMALWPDIPNVAAESGSIDGLTQWSWLQNDFNTGTRVTPLSFFTTANNSFISDADLFSGKGTAFSGQTQVRFYGFNYTVNASAKVRWGFAWNENSAGLFPSGDQGSNDVSGGIGMSSTYGNYSAGDKINCCQNTTGINRSARVEIYIR